MKQVTILALIYFVVVIMSCKKSSSSPTPPPDNDCSTNNYGTYKASFSNKSLSHFFTAQEFDNGNTLVGKVFKKVLPVGQLSDTMHLKPLEGPNYWYTTFGSLKADGTINYISSDSTFSVHQCIVSSIDVGDGQ